MNKEAKGTHDYIEDPRNLEVLVYVNGNFVLDRMLKFLYLIVVSC